MKNKYNVLIFPCGGENAINIFDSLKYNIHFNLYGASQKKDYASSIYPKDRIRIGSYSIKDSNFVLNLNKLIKEWNIDLLIPTHDEVAEVLMKNEKRIKTNIVCSNYNVTKIANNKYKQMKSLNDASYIPKIYNNKKDVVLPVFVKPYIGAGGKKTKLITTQKELEEFWMQKKNFLVSEYLPGDEITVDCFSNYKGQLIFIGPRTRERITMGISFESSRIECTKEIENIALDLNERFKFNGAWFFQLKKNKDNEYRLMEFSVRQAGTMALYRQIGINFALLSLFNALKIDTKIIFNDYGIKLNRRLSNSYTIDLDYDTVYIDFDDTIIVNNKINKICILFLYQCIEKGKKIVLLSKHDTDIYQDLKKYKICKDIFDEIKVLNNTEDKYKYISVKKSIFIDNYFADRLVVHEKCKIPVFDVDAIEALIDTKEI